MPETIRLQNRDVPFTREQLQVDQLQLDPTNPRLQFLIGRRADPVSDDELDEILWSKEPVKALSESIRRNGGVIEPIIVQMVGANYTVREGNSRTVALRRLSLTHPNDPRFESVPAMVFAEELGVEDLAVLLASMHVAGKIRWDAYEQAKHVYDLHNVYGKTYDWLAAYLRLSKAKITQDLKAYGWTTDFLEAHGLQDVERFAFFQELARKRSLAARYLEDADFREAFARWLNEGKLSASAQVRKLDLVLASEEATTALDERGFSEASKVLIREDPSLGSDLFVSIKRATERLANAPLAEVRGLRADERKVAMLRNLQAALNQIVATSEIEL
jgi:hypothetical protein